jgi:hypothetical protein
MVGDGLLEGVGGGCGGDDDDDDDGGGGADGNRGRIEPFLTHYALNDQELADVRGVIQRRPLPIEFSAGSSNNMTAQSRRLWFAP